MIFSLIIKDYDTHTPLSNKHIEITNIDSKQTQSNITNNNGEVSFEISKSEVGDFFSIKLLDEVEYEQTPYYLARECIAQTKHTQRQTNNAKQEASNNNLWQTRTTGKHTTQKILTPNSYTNHPAILYFEAQISLYFNGTTLCIIKGKESLAHYNARSGKALSQEEKIELEQQGYKIFVDSINSGFICDGVRYFCLDKKWQSQKDNGAIPEGEYYINANTKKTTDIQKNTSLINTKIYTDKECTNVVESSTNRDNFYLHRGDTFSNASGIDIQSNGYDFSTTIHNKPTTQKAIKLQVTYQNRLESHIEFIRHIDEELERDMDYIDSNIPFAPGSYIELEIAQDSNNTQSNNADTIMQWAFIMLYNQKDVDSIFTNDAPYTFHTLLDRNQAPSQEHNVKIFKNDMSIDTTKIGFSLPLIREYEDSTQCFVIVFAFEHTKAKPDITDPYKIIDMSFKVGEYLNEGVIQTKREKQNLEQRNIYNQTSINNLKAWNTLQCICNIKEAVDFLRANINKMEELKKKHKIRYEKRDSYGNPNHIFDYFRIYPSLAGKIAYIYYRFDLGDEEFVEKAHQTCYLFFSCKDEYKRDREEYIQSIAELFDKKQPYFHNKTFLQKYKEIFSKDNPHNILPTNEKMDQRKHFIEYLVFKIIEKLNLSYPSSFTFNKDTANQRKDIVAFFQEEPKKQQNGGISLYGGYVKNKTIYLNTLIIEKGNFTFATNDIYYPFRHIITFEYMLNIIFHEIRHFYINEKYKDSDSSMLKKYIHWSLWFYIKTSVYPVIFDRFNKQCSNNDKSNVGCIANANQDAYEIQPNERDPRYVANQITKKLKSKGL